MVKSRPSLLKMLSSFCLSLGGELFACGPCAGLERWGGEGAAGALARGGSHHDRMLAQQVFDAASREAGTAVVEALGEELHRTELQQPLNLSEGRE